MNCKQNILSLYIASSYVATLYISDKHNKIYGSKEGIEKRDDPAVVKSRMKYVCGMILINILVLPLIIHYVSPISSNYFYILKQFGLFPGYSYQDTTAFDISGFLIGLLKSVILIAALYIAVLLDNLFYYLIFDEASALEDVTDEFSNILGIRNFLFGPITEEITYTSFLIISMMITVPGISFKKLVFLPPLYFGLAHLHHAHSKLQSGLYTKKSIIISTLFQFFYTFWFGSLTDYIFLKTGGNLYACIFLHSWCNYNAFPPLSSQAAYIHQELKKIEEEGETAKRTNKLDALMKIWRYIYIAGLPFGVYIFQLLLNRM